MKTNWHLTALEFLVAWEHLGLDRLPPPLSYLGTADTTDEFDTQKVAAARTLVAKGDDNLHRALAVLAEPVAEAVICGVDSRASERMVRIRAGVDRTYGAVATQLPGHTCDAGSDILVSLCRRGDMGKAVAEALPSVSAGTTKGITVHRSDLESNGGGSFMRSAGYVSPRAAAAKFFNRQHSMIGEIMVSEGDRHDGRRAAPGEVLQWIDFADDGRYVVRSASTIAAVPATPTVVAGEIQRMLARAEAEIARF